MPRLPHVSLEPKLFRVPTPLPDLLFRRKYSNKPKWHHSFEVRNVENRMQVRERSRINKSRDHLSSARCFMIDAVRSDVIPIQQYECDSIFVGGKPCTTVAVAGIDGLYAFELMDLRRRPHTPCDFLVTIHSHEVHVVTSDVSQSAHKPTASGSRAHWRIRNHPPSDPAPLLNSHGANSTKAVSNHGSNF